MTAKQTVEGWIKEALSDTEKDGPLSAFSLVHVVGMTTEEVHSVKVGGKSFSAQQWAELFEHKAQGRAQNLPGTQYFKLLAFYNGANQPSAAFPMKVEESGEVARDGHGALLDAPTKEGFAGQAMRHVQIMHSQIFNRQTAMDQVTQGMIAQAYSMVGSLAATVERLTHENIAAVEFVKKVVLEADENKHKRRIEELTLMRSIQREEGLMRLLPSLANTVSGRKIFPEAAEDTALIEALADGIPLDRVSQLVAMLKVPPEVQGAIMSRFERAVKDKAEREAKAKELVGSTANVEDELGAPALTEKAAE